MTTEAATVSVVPKDEGFNVFVQRPGYSLNVLYLPTVEAAKQLLDAVNKAVRQRESDEMRFTVHFRGGPWDGQTTEVERVVAPVFAVGHEVGNHYWLDTKSDPPTYHWDGTNV